MGCRVVCLAGACWLTQAGDNRCHMLFNGHSFTLSMQGRIVIPATEDCHLLLFAKPQKNIHTS
ncbi:DUF2917 domain-containing protein [Malonomonas rubra]|uniref:DUF2917 domain-containing protein n=1 Tax=Malonomonas rubra TaxID=57040 RepID=UPI0034E93878